MRLDGNTAFIAAVHQQKQKTITDAMFLWRSIEKFAWLPSSPSSFAKRENKTKQNETMQILIKFM